jgi:hypothetical protein
MTVAGVQPVVICVDAPTKNEFSEHPKKIGMYICAEWIRSVLGPRNSALFKQGNSDADAGLLS